MGLGELYLIRRPLAFGGYEWDRRNTPFSLFGAPFDSTVSFKPGARFAPDYLRIYSRSLELNSPRSGLFMEDLGIYDEGDAAVVHGDAAKTVEILEAIYGDLVAEGRIPIMIGGEHTVSLGPARFLGKSKGKAGFLVFDAHADFRDDYLGQKLSHACVSRRVVEILGPGSVIITGVRAFTREELRASLKEGVVIITSAELRKEGRRAAASKILRWMEGFSRIHVSVDIDVLDPAFAPGTGAPEPDGIATWELLDLLHDTADPRVASFDLVEINPLADPAGSTSILGAKIVFEMASYIYRASHRGGEGSS